MNDLLASRFRYFLALADGLSPEIAQQIYAETMNWGFNSNADYVFRVKGAPNDLPL